MPAWLDGVIPIVLAILLLLINAAAVALVLLQLQGTWLILLATTALAWWRWEDQTISAWTLGWLLALAVLGELIELLSASVGSARVGGSRRGALLALVGGVAGAILGSFVMPVVGTVAGACVGAGMGSYGGDRWAGRSTDQAAHAGREAAKGRFVGTIAKVAVAVVMWVVVALALVI